MGKKFKCSPVYSDSSTINYMTTTFHPNPRTQYVKSPFKNERSKQVQLNIYKHLKVSIKDRIFWIDIPWYSRGLNIKPEDWAAGLDADGGGDGGYKCEDRVDKVAPSEARRRLPRRWRWRWRWRGRSWRSGEEGPLLRPPLNPPRCLRQL